MIRNLICLFFYMTYVQVVSAQVSSMPARFRGEIVSVTSTELTIIDREKKELKFEITPDQAVQEVYPISKSMIEINSYIGSAGVVGADGSVKALEVLVFPEQARGTGEGHYPWDLQQGSTMTNATVDQLKQNENDLELSVQFKGGQKKIHVENGTPIVSIKPGDRKLLTPGAFVMITAIKKENQWSIIRINAGRDGFRPPM